MPDEEVIAHNKHLQRHYRIIRTLIAGIVLYGPEIKAIRQYKININHAYISISSRQEFFLVNAPINAQFTNLVFVDYDAKRVRKLLLNKQEMRRWAMKKAKQKLTIIPQTVFLNKKNLLKVKICLCSGLKKHDKRQYEKTKDLARETRANYKLNFT